MAAWDQHASPIAEIDVLWITAGLGCDGDTIAMTAATQPSVEDIVLGGMPWTPKVNFHNPFLSIENGEEFLLRFHQAAEGNLDPFILVIEGSIPNENNKARDTGRRWAPIQDGPAHHHLRVDRSARAQSLGRDCGRDVRNLRRNPCHGRQSDRLHGPA